MMEEKIQQYIPKKVKVDFCGNVASFEVPVSGIVKIAEDLYNHSHLSLKMITATDDREKQGCFKIWYVFGVPKDNIFIVPYIKLKNINEFPSITSITHEAWNYEKKIRTFFG